MELHGNFMTNDEIEDFMDALDKNNNGLLEYKGFLGLFKFHIYTNQIKS